MSAQGTRIFGVQLTTFAETRARAALAMPPLERTFKMANKIRRLAAESGVEFYEERWLHETKILGLEYAPRVMRRFFALEVLLAPALSRGWLVSRGTCDGQTFYAGGRVEPELSQYRWTGEDADLPDPVQASDAYELAVRSEMAAIRSAPVRVSNELGHLPLPNGL